jgi:MOSC domain-containing protein YiiM
VIKSIYIADVPGHQRRKVVTASVVSGKGIAGDRNYGRSDWPGQNVTFIEVEEIDRYNAEYGQRVEDWEFGRNVVTDGVRLNSLVGKTFNIGSAKFVGIELCEPCATLGGYLANESITSSQCVKGLAHRAGLRADVIEDGSIEEGMSLIVHDTHE